jgi:hypothetical protein
MPFGIARRSLVAVGSMPLGAPSPPAPLPSAEREEKRRFELAELIVV